MAAAQSAPPQLSQKIVTQRRVFDAIQISAAGDEEPFDADAVGLEPGRVTAGRPEAVFGTADDRADALVRALTALMEGGGGPRITQL